MQKENSFITSSSPIETGRLNGTCCSFFRISNYTKVFGCLCMCVSLNLSFSCFNFGRVFKVISVEKVTYTQFDLMYFQYSMKKNICFPFASQNECFQSGTNLTDSFLFNRTSNDESETLSVCVCAAGKGKIEMNVSIFNGDNGCHVPGSYLHSSIHIQLLPSLLLLLLPLYLHSMWHCNGIDFVVPHKKSKFNCCCCCCYCCFCCYCYVIALVDSRLLVRTMNDAQKCSMVSFANIYPITCVDRVG